MKKLLILLTFLPCFVVAQDTIKLPISVAKQIAVDLSECDSLVDILISVDNELTVTKEVVREKDNLLASANSNVLNLTKQVQVERDQKDYYKTLYATKKNDYEELSKHHRRHKALRNFIDITVGAAAAIVIYILAK